MEPRRVFKYPIPIDDVFSLELPQSAQILTAQIQGGTPYLSPEIVIHL